MDNYNVFAEMARPVIMKYLNQPALTADEKKYLDMMNSWNLVSDVNEKGATVFNVIWDSLETTIWGDEFAGATTNIGWPDEITLLESLQRDSLYSFADNIKTKNKVETISDAVMEAIKKATVVLQKADKEGKLGWAAFKDTRVSHLLS